MNEEEWLEELTKIDMDLRSELREKRYQNLNKYVPCVEYIINPYANNPLPMNAFAKGYKTLNEYDLSTGELNVIYDWSKNTLV